MPRDIRAVPDTTRSGWYPSTTYFLNASRFDTILPSRPYNISTERSELPVKLPAHWAQLLAANTPRLTVSALHELFMEIFTDNRVESVELMANSQVHNPRLTVHYTDKDITRRRYRLRSRHAAVFRAINTFAAKTANRP